MALRVVVLAVFFLYFYNKALYLFSVFDMNGVQGIEEGRGIRDVAVCLLWLS